MWRSLVSRLVRVQEAVGSNPATPTKNPQIFVQQAQKSEDFSFAKPGYLCVTPKPGNAEKSDHRSDYLVEMLTRSKRRQDRQRARCFAVSGLLILSNFRTLSSASPRSASLCLGVSTSDYMTITAAPLPTGFVSRRYAATNSHCGKRHETTQKCSPDGFSV